MAQACAIQRYTPRMNPDFALVKVARTGNYTTGGDTVNLNPGTWTDPNGVGLLGQPLAVTKTPVAVDSEADVGYYAQIVAGATLATFKIQYFASEGAELAQAAYPAAILNGSLVLRIPLTD